MDAGQIMMMPVAAQAIGMQLEEINQPVTVLKNSEQFDQLLSSVAQENIEQDSLLTEKDSVDLDINLNLKLQQTQNNMVLEPSVFQMMALMFASTKPQAFTDDANAGEMAKDVMQAVEITGVEAPVQTRVETPVQTRVEAEQTTKAPAAWLVYGRPVQIMNHTDIMHQSQQVLGENREAGSAPTIVMSQPTESEVVMPGLAESRPDESDMQHGQSGAGTAHQYGVTVQTTTRTIQGDVAEVAVADSEKTVVSDQIARQVVNHLKPFGGEQSGDRSVTFRLSPEHLGDIQLSMHMDAKQGVKIEIVAENRGVRETLLRQEDDLRETLARQNIKMDSFDVSTGLGGSTSQQTRDWRQQLTFPQQPQRFTGGGRKLFRESDEIPIRYIEAQYQSTLDVRF